MAISDYKFGMDRRRPRVSGIPGTLWNLKNAHITRGGDIESMKKFVPTFSLPDNTFGLGQINGQIWVFGSADIAASMPSGVQYQRLQDPGGAAMTRVLSNNTFDRKHYVVAEFSNGFIHHFYDGVRVTDWDTVADGNTNVTILAEYMASKINASTTVEATSFGAKVNVTANTPGTAFSISSATVDGGANPDQTLIVTTLQPNVAEVAEVRATGTITVTGGTTDPGVNTITATVDGVALTAAPVDFISSPGATANALAVQINNLTSTHGYSASAAGPVVTVRAAVGLGAAPNGDVVASIVTGDVTASTANMAGGVTYVAPVAQVSQATFGGTFQAADRFTLTIDGTDYVATGRAAGYGTFAFTYKSREYITAGSLLQYSELNDPDDFATGSGTATGTGSINLSSDSEGSERLTAIAPYQNSLAIFSQSQIRTYSINTDATLNSYEQTIENTGTFAPRSVVAYGNIDVFYLDMTGIRSIQSRDVTNAPVVDDAGSAIDTFVQEWAASLSDDVVQRAVGAIEPIDGRFMLAIGERVYVLSYFPKAKITAWSYYEPGFAVSDFLRVRNRLYARDGDTIYLYGGRTGQTYPDAGETPIAAELPFANAQSIATFKQWLAFDMACSGTWHVDLLPDPNDETKTIEVGNISKTTYGLPDIAVVGEFPLFAMSLTCESGGRATLSNMAFHYETTRAG
ncbi:MAG TPA: hypothetical protein VIU82_26020 [Bosea sp. (in: a-proteobacteria)]